MPLERRRRLIEDKRVREYQGVADMAKIARRVFKSSQSYAANCTSRTVVVISTVIIDRTGEITRARARTYSARTGRGRRASNCVRCVHVRSHRELPARSSQVRPYRGPSTDSRRNGRWYKRVRCKRGDEERGKSEQGPSSENVKAAGGKKGKVYIFSFLLTLFRVEILCERENI